MLFHDGCFHVGYHFQGITASYGAAQDPAIIHGYRKLLNVIGTHHVAIMLTNAFRSSVDTKCRRTS